MKLIAHSGVKLDAWHDRRLAYGQIGVLPVNSAVKAVLPAQSDRRKRWLIDRHSLVKITSEKSKLKES